MVGGFTFDGVDIADLNLEYAPELTNTYVYKPAAAKNHEQVFDGHDGGYYYGSSTQPKEFTLRCFYEAQHVSGGVMTRIYNTFKRGKTGRLVFKKRPWCWYTATVTNVEAGQMFNFENGVVSISLKAYYPFARSDYLGIPAGSEYRESMLANSALIDENVVSFATSFANVGEPIQAEQSILLYNPGTERAKVAIRIAGDVGTGISIDNNTTGQSSRFVAITPDVCANNYYIQSDGLSGQTVLTNGTVVKPGFLYHDYGFIELDPGFPAYRDVIVTIENTTDNSVFSDGKFTSDMLGRYIYFRSGESAKIVNVVDENIVVIDKHLTNSDSGPAQILKMNELYVKPNPAGGQIRLTKLDFVFKPTYA